MKKLLFCLLIVLNLDANLEDLSTRVKWDLDHHPYPDTWRVDDENILEVAIVGAGMAGMAAAFGLKKVGIHRIVLLDQSEQGEEGPWTHLARMKTLRSTKDGTGPCLFLPSLTFHAWYEAKFGEKKWEELEKGTPKEWMEYLCWFRNILNLPVVNQCKVLKITPLKDNLFCIECEKSCYYARKVVLATGREGFGGKEIPPFMTGVPKEHYSHTSEIIDFSSLRGKRIVVIGAGASAFDAAAEALEKGASTVELIFRRKHIHPQNIMDLFAHVGFEQGYHLLSDEWRWTLMTFANECGTPPPESALARLKNQPEFQMKSEVAIFGVQAKKDLIEISTNQGLLACDYVILGTGFHIGGDKTPELQDIFPHLLLWKDQFPQAENNHLGNLPYLGSHFQFFEKMPGKAPFLRHLYCFNWGALLSHGLTSSSIDALSAGADRLSKGIAADFFLEEVDFFYEQLKK